MARADEDARLAYELSMKRRISDTQWWKVRKLLTKHKLEVTATNAQFWAKLRQKVPRTAVGVDGLIDAYRRADELTKRAKGTLKGSEIVKILLQFGISAHRTTIGRWFSKSAGGYKQNREYKPEEVRDILIDAFLYKATRDNSDKLPKAN